MHKEEYLQSEDDVSTMSPVLPGDENKPNTTTSSAGTGT